MRNDDPWYDRHVKQYQAPGYLASKLRYFEDEGVKVALLAQWPIRYVPCHIQLSARNIELSLKEPFTGVVSWRDIVITADFVACREIKIEYVGKSGKVCSLGRIRMGPSDNSNAADSNR